MNVHIDKLVFGGQGMGRTDDGKIAFVWDAIPGEDAELDVIKNKANLVEANAFRILTPAPERIAPREKHYLSCSPWQILSFDAENAWKVKMAQETYEKIGGFALPNLDIVTDPDAQYGYRNKIEYSFTEIPSLDKGGLGRVLEVTFAFFERGRRYKTAIETCELASAAINETANIILSWVNEQHIPTRSLKTLIVRSNQPGETIAALFIKDRLTFPSYPKLPPTCLGFQIYYSTHKSPAAVPTALLYESGQQWLTETVRGRTFKYGIFSFFQINIPLFATVLEEITKHIDQKTPVVDLYSGVGAIGIATHANQPLTLVEINDEATAYAKENIAKNNINHAEAILAPAERALDAITGNATLLLDPPREGLHDDVVKTILKVLPQTIIYLSCNLATHARDLAKLATVYDRTFLRLYNFFPRTPHIEALCVLHKKGKTQVSFSTDPCYNNAG
jgi:23S rRNA (uracil1939-C5)-methyltransferase